MIKKIPEIRENQSIELLKELHILTRNGDLNQDSRRKLKQVYHLYNFIEPLLKESFKDEHFSLVDHGAGKSYLGFILYDLFFKDKDSGTIYGIEHRDELVQKSIDLAKRLNFLRMKFLSMTVEASNQHGVLPKQIDVVTALHACDTATDNAIEFALNKDAKFIVLVPCCQAEVASVLRKNKSADLTRTPLTEMWRHPIHTREFGSHITNVLRALQLEAHGYQVTITELVGFEHSMKNELIIAKKIGGPQKKAIQKIEWLLNEIGLNELKARFFSPMAEASTKPFGPS